MSKIGCLFRTNNSENAAITGASAGISCMAEQLNSTKPGEATISVVVRPCRKVRCHPVDCHDF